LCLRIVKPHSRPGLSILFKHESPSPRAGLPEGYRRSDFSCRQALLTSTPEYDAFAQIAQGGIEVTALHSHMLAETPRLFFMHFWGVGSPETIGAALKAALAKVNTKP
jgi:hypothetical protein